LRALRPDLPETLANIVALALEKRVEVRYADCGQLPSDLREVAAQIAPRPPASPGVIKAPETARFVSGRN
jgi:eukaryotic-like serine/threonine-protein kinase